MSAHKHVLFVCTGNTCRSPMAEGLLRKAVAGRDDFAVSSAGVAASKGAPVSRETLKALTKRGAKLENFRSRPVSDEILEAATHVFAMTEGHLAALEACFPHHSDKFFLVREFSGIADKREGIDVPDPIGMGPAAYEEVAKLLETAIPSIVAYVDSVGAK
ncbi:MAG: low molecular weight protein arginine phosphatase [Akkermansiaceae bacterium]|jgi:protein-tyrosine-phosphatase|nr:low molecular weight protein arginine phosphatase [Akkermansiaceae bacterium]